MKKIVGIFLLGAAVFTACKGNDKEQVSVVVDESKYEFFGTKFALDKEVKDSGTVFEVYQNMVKGDSVPMKFASTINEVCQKKGCWLSLDLTQDKKSFVKFKDYAFFAPMNAGGHEVVVDGKAFVSVIPVDELKHYAEDAGKTEEEIALITEPKITYGFMADGIAIKKAK